MTRRRKSIAFNEHEKDLLDHVGTRGEFSSVVKQYIRSDMKNVENDNLSGAVNELIELITSLKFEIQDLKMEVKYLQQQKQSEPLIPQSPQHEQPETIVDFSDLDDL